MLIQIVTGAIHFGHHGVQLYELLFITIYGVLNAGGDRSYLAVQAVEVGIDAFGRVFDDTAGLDITLDLVMDLGGHTRVLAVPDEEVGDLIGFIIQRFFQLGAVDFQFAGFGIG